jgi:hypothetical protein
VRRKTEGRVALRYPACVTPGNENDLGVDAGLCADCVHARWVESARSSFFLLCELSATNPEFPRYPRLPVIQCGGFAPKAIPQR